jgi:methionyl-tRNA formyltransferase
LAFRCRAVAATALGEALDDFARLWQERRPQSTPTYCHVPTIADRTIDWSAPVEQIDRLLRAFKPGTVRACVGGRTLLVYNASCWKERHQVPAGTAVSTFGGERLVAASDGFVALRATAPLWVARAWRRLSCLPGLRRFLP